MKRPREEVEAQHVEVNLASLLMFLSSNAAVQAQTAEYDDHQIPSGRVFECKTCNRQFPSFQALGGHRASHKKPRLLDEGQPKVSKPRVHECSICGLEFALGQALGGHMRRHRAAAEGGGVVVHPHHGEEEMVGKKRKMVLLLDLNMPAPVENDPLLAFGLGPPLVH